MKRLFETCGKAFIWLVLTMGLYAVGVLAYSNYLVENRVQVTGWPETFDFTDPVDWKTDSPNVVRILAMDGGALYGLSQLEILKAIEEETGKRTHELFDFVTGASTGAIIGALLFKPGLDGSPPPTAAEAIDIYDEYARDILGIPVYHAVLTGRGLFGPVIPNQGRLKVFRDGFGGSRFNELLRPALFPVFSQEENRLRLFRNWDKVDSNIYLHALIGAATSAPMFFPAINFNGEHASGAFFDAGLVLNSPGEIAYLQARTNLPDHKNFVVVSIGTKPQQIVSSRTAEAGGVIDWLAPILEIVFSGEDTISQDTLEQLSKIDPAVTMQSFFLAPNDVEGVSGFGHTKSASTSIRTASQDFVEENNSLIREVARALSIDVD